VKIPSIPAKPEMLRAGLVTSDASIGVDRENNILRGYVVAQLGHFKSEGRGQFSQDSLAKIVELGNAAPKGLRSRFSHPSMSDDGLGKYLGRSKNYRLDGDKVRADLHFDQTALKTPPSGGRPYADYIMELAENDPGALGSSLVLKPERIPQETEGEPDVWMPERLLASDIVDEGDATHGDLLSVEGLDQFMEGSEHRLPSKVAVAAMQYLSQLFPDSDREVVASRIDGFRDRYLSTRFGAANLEVPKEKPVDEETKNAIESLAKSTDEKLSKLTDLISQDMSNRKAELSKEQRKASIGALCAMAGQANKANDFIKDESLSAEDVRAKLFEDLCNKNKPAADDPAGENGQLSVDHDTKFREEYLSHKKYHDQLGITEAKYIARRRREEKLPQEAAK
jgi:hypothetical protein